MELVSLLPKEAQRTDISLKTVTNIYVVSKLAMIKKYS